jgi:hypothetical protein
MTLELTTGRLATFAIDVKPDYGGFSVQTGIEIPSNR